MNCIIVDKNDVAEDGSIALGVRESTHIIHVLKKNAGDSILVGMVDGPMSVVPILSITDKVVCVGLPRGPIPPEPPVDLILAMPRPKVMKRLWAPLASMGLRRITIIATERVEACYFDSHAIVPDIYRPLLVEGLEQARDTRMPVVNIVKSFRWFAEKHLCIDEPDTIKLIGHPGAHTSVRDAATSSTGAKRITLAVGPEGGWTADEISAFQSYGYIQVGMRERALRTDTAIISLMALVYDAIGSSKTS